MRELILHDTTPGCHFHDWCPRLAHINLSHMNSASFTSTPFILFIYQNHMIYFLSPLETVYFKNPFLECRLFMLSSPPANKCMRVTGECRSNKAYFSEYIWQICDKKICKRLFLYYYNKRSRLNSEPSEGSVSANYKYTELFSTVSEEEFMCSFLFVKKRPNIMNFPQEIKKKYWDKKTYKTSFTRVP